MSGAHPRPDPTNEDDAQFWSALRDGELRIQRCAACRTLRHPPGPVCARCGATGREWVVAAGTGEVWSFTVIHPPTLPAFADRTPYGAVVVRLDRQTLTAYLDGKPVLSAPVTTGRPALPTPIGSFSIHSRSSPYIFTSPWPKSSPYWYPPTPATWAMYFYDNDFLHDDPGEPASAYGAGSQDGPYASHGCVHVPRDAMAFLFQWLPVGATVIVARD